MWSTFHARAVLRRPTAKEASRGAAKNFVTDPLPCGGLVKTFDLLARGMPASFDSSQAMGASNRENSSASIDEPQGLYSLWARRWMAASALVAVVSAYCWPFSWVFSLSSINRLATASTLKPQ